MTIDAETLAKVAAAAIERLPEKEREEARALLVQMEKAQRYNKIQTLFPDIGPYRREFYPKHVSWLQSKERERALMGGNQVGKSDTLLYCVALHALGMYPDWWQGTRYTKPRHIWIGDTTNEQLRDVIQVKLLGDVGQEGTGIIPKAYISNITKKRGMADAVDFFQVRQPNGGKSTIWLKSYEQGRAAWQGKPVHIVAFNEEPPEEIYTEGSTRTLTTHGEILLAFTPMEGMSTVCKRFLEEGIFHVNIGWIDAPHLTEEDKAAMRLRYPPHEVDARTRGIPMIGRGLIYPIDEERITCSPIAIPKHWARGYGLDVGWKKTAALWGALDRESDILYLYSQHYEGESVPAVHASAIKARGKLRGFIDPASRGRSQKDGTKLIEEYTGEGLLLMEADNAVEAGIFNVWERMTTGRLKIFSTLHETLKERRMYHRDKHGKPVKEDDHLMDALRYLSMMVRFMGYVETDANPQQYQTRGGVRYLSSVPNARNQSLHARPEAKRA